MRNCVLFQMMWDKTLNEKRHPTLQCFCPKKTQKEDAMDSLPQIGARNYTPHLYQTRLHSCKRIRESHWEVWKVLSYYHVKRSSLYRWLKRYDELGEDGLKDRSHKPKTPHPSTICPKAAYKAKCFHDQAEFVKLRRWCQLRVASGVRS